jgi:hypothetical protein
MLLRETVKLNNYFHAEPSIKTVIMNELLLIIIIINNFMNVLFEQSQ